MTEYRTRERLQDTEDNGGILVVIEAAEKRAEEFELVDGVSVADVYDTALPTDRVVKCVYQRQLDKIRPNWRELAPEKLREWFDEFEQMPAGVQVLPSSRLDRYTGGNFTETDDGFHCENCDCPVGSATDWLEHVARDCSGVSV